MANPLSWLPFHGDKRSSRAALLGGALTLSLAAHLGLPFMNWHRVEAVSETPVQVTLMPPPPMPLPEADEPKISPDEDDSPDPKVPDKPVAKAEAPKPVEPKPIEPPPEPPPEKAQPPPLLKTTDADKRLAELEKRRADRIAAMQARRAAAIAAREAARAKQGSGGVKGGAPDTGEWKTGKPDAVYLCNGDDKGMELHVTKSRPLSEWIAIVPTVLAGFETRPSLGGYLDHMQQVVSRDRNQGPKRIGFVELSLPNDVMQMPLDEPRGVKVAIGRLDAKCLIGFKYSNQLFPFTLQRVPVRIIDASNNTVAALVDVTFYKDVSLDIVSADGTDLPFKRARLKNGANIQRNIEDHYEAARLAKSIADLFGIDLRPKTKDQLAAAAKAKANGNKPPAPKATIAEGKPPKRQQD